MACASTVRVGCESPEVGNTDEKYRALAGQLDFKQIYLAKRFRVSVLESASGGLNQQPSLLTSDGLTISLNTTQWQFMLGGEAIALLSDHWSVGAGSYFQFTDPKAQYEYNARPRAAVEWDAFSSDDPRGNRLGVFYHLGWDVDRYNIRNELGERFAQYPVTGVDAVGSVRHDGISYGLYLSSDVQVNHPTRRFSITASPFSTFQIGRHVDLSVAISVTQRQLPKPDLSLVEPSDYQTLSRLSYAEAFVMSGTIGLTLHWDPTNGARNDRITSI